MNTRVVDDLKVFSGQKGASEDDKKVLESGMIRAAELLKRLRGIDVSDMPGAGAAGNEPTQLFGFEARRLATI